jgi:hypothetical protein
MYPPQASIHRGHGSTAGIDPSTIDSTIYRPSIPRFIAAAAPDPSRSSTHIGHRHTSAIDAPRPSVMMIDPSRHRPPIRIVGTFAIDPSWPIDPSTSAIVPPPLIYRVH